MADYRWDFTIKVGSSFRRSFTWIDKATGNPIDLTGCTAVMKIRDSWQTTSAVLVEIDTAGAGIVLGGAAGTIALDIAATATAGIAILAMQGDPPGRLAAHDILITFPNGDVRALWEGDCTFTRSASA